MNEDSKDRIYDLAHDLMLALNVKGSECTPNEEQLSQNLMDYFRQRMMEIANGNTMAR